MSVCRLESLAIYSLSVEKITVIAQNVETFTVKLGLRAIVRANRNPSEIE